MAYKQVSDLRDSVSAQLQGLNLNSVTGINGIFERAARELSHDIEVQETDGRQAVTIYDKVIEYPAPSDIFGSSLIDFQQQGNSRSPIDYNYKQPISTFDRTKAWLPNGTQITFEYRSGTGIMRIVSAIPTPRIEFDPMTDTTGWTTGGVGGTLVQDKTVLYNQPASLRFPISGAGTATLTKSTLPSNDLTDYRGIGVLFIPYRVSDATKLTSVTLRIGSSAGAYYTVTATADFLGAFQTNQWSTLSFDLSTATTVGVPDITKMTYAQILVVASGAIGNIWFGDLFISLPSPFNMIYSTAAFFLPTAAGSTPSRTISSNSDYVTLTDEAFAIYEVKCAILTAHAKGGTLASGVVSTLDQKLNGVRGYRGLLIQPGLLDLYRANNPAQRQRVIQNWYDE